ncbi:MAG: tetratricopeptide repeat protein [Zoogloea sp.]|uniref:L,D-transpeptidase Cds6 family protein n=1 Tax=Zoogloea sp. TaxID=49181 RepID=UPI002639E278|nr:tetratricopeptide repeat protein [Zoogloea sp.]MDD3326768.1 tetratricopeptide repeat protein [Zoogloea sp.]
MSKRALAASLLLASLICSPVRADPVQDLQALVKQGQLSQALEKADQLLASKPRDAQVRFLRGVILSELNRGSEAISVFQKLTEDYPELPEPYNNLAVLYAQQRQYDKARNALEMAIRTHPSYATAHENLGDIYARLASQAYDKALALDSSNVVAQNKLALIREMMTVGGKTVRPATPAVAAKPAPTVVAAAPVAPPAKPAVTPPPAVAPAPVAKPAPAVVAAVAPAAKPVAPPPTPVPAPVAKPSPAPQPAAVPAKEDPKVAAKPKDETPAQAAAIGKAVQSWAGAWSRKDVKSYLSHYGREFEPPKGLNRKAWEEERNQRLTKPGDIEVNLENVKVVSVTGDRATVKLRQHYRSANLSTSSNKTLNLMLQDGKWVIVQERVGG